MAIPGVVEGVVNQVCERNFFEIGAKTVANILGSDYISVGRIMETADQQGTPLVTLLPKTTISDEVSSSMSAAARTQIEKYLGLGYAVVVPGKPIGVGSALVTGFWAIDPVTGRTIDRLENGAGSELPEEATLLDVVIHAVHEAYVLGTCVVGLCFAAAALISMAIWGYSGGLLAGAVGGAVHGGGFCLAAAL